jgi:[ribosomal protein S18]-alanine N-acetyltransferase
MQTTEQNKNTVKPNNLWSEVAIRPFRLEDLEAVMNIEPLAFGANHWSRQVFINELNGTAGIYFVATESLSRRLLGYSGFWLIGEEAHITTLAVHPDHLRQYIGERLLINNILQARQLGARWLTLEVRASNEAAQKLYGKYGFKSLGTRPRYYQDNLESAIILWSENIETQSFNQLFNERIVALKKYTGEF